MAIPFASLTLQLACLMIILVAFHPATVSTREADVYIPSDYKRYPEINKAYKVHTELRTWSEAKQACINEGGRLAIIDTMKKVRKVASQKGFNVHVWIGISRKSSGSSWVSAGNGMRISNIPWAPLEPWGSSNCLAVRGCNQGLTNKNCSNSLGFVCEMTINTEFGEIGAN